ncbi:MAG: hypothetical protein ACRCZH_01385 [Cetobacterium sp.]
MNYIEKMKNNVNYMELKRINRGDEVDKYLAELKEAYIKTFREPHMYYALGFSEEAEKEKHSKQSEILGKIVCLTHEFEGFKGVQKVLHDLFWEYQELVAQQLEEHEQTIELFKSQQKKYD